ncbi:zinc ribbon domain-containing protein [Simkania negevensis]|nr:hypothetical protein [Simkania negevensis]
MKQVDRTKVCWSCEADVSYEATYCPFCGTDLLTSTIEPKEEQPRQDERFSTQSLEESLASLYKPPYSVRNKQGLGVPDEREEPSFKQVKPPREDPLFQTYDPPKAKEPIQPPPQPKAITEEKGSERGGVLPLLLLSIGINLSLLGLLILLFSKEGVVNLQWSSHYWFIYLLIGLPTTYFGVRSLKQLL